MTSYWDQDYLPGTPGEPPEPGPPPLPGEPSDPGGPAAAEPGPPRPRSRRPRALRAALIGLLAAALAAAVVVTLAHRHAAPPLPRHTASPGPARSAATAPAAAAPPAITQAGAQAALLNFILANNTANRDRSTARLAAVEAGSALRMDTGAYRWTKVTDPANHGYVPLAFAHPAYAIPRIPAGTYPKWWAVHGTWVTSGTRPAPRGTGWLLFLQRSAGTGWKVIIEPADVPGTRPAPAPAVDKAGYATAVTGGTGLAVPPPAVPAQTAAALSGTGHAVAVSTRLASLTDLAFWRAHLPARSSVTETRQPSGPVYALAASGGGALLFFTTASKLTITPPRRQMMGIQIPGYYSARHPVRTAAVTYAEQFVLYDPPPGPAGSRPWVTGDISGIDGRA